MHEMKQQVYCAKCRTWIDLDRTKFLNIEEDVYGKDLVTFRCPRCKTDQVSNVTNRDF